jgi:hypothetical protein
MTRHFFSTIFVSIDKMMHLFIENTSFNFVLLYPRMKQKRMRIDPFIIDIFHKQNCAGRISVIIVLLV